MSAPLIRGAAMLALLATSSAAAADDAERGTLSVTVENDLFSGTDRDYTSGVRFDYISAPNDLIGLGRFAKRHLNPHFEAENWYMIYGIGQTIFTPSDITDPAPPQNERPYAGFLFGTIGVAAASDSALNTIALDLGVVGPLSGAERTQKLVHDIIDVDKPVGWDLQLENEPAFRLVLEHKRRSVARLPTGVFDLGVDALPHANLSLGTLDTSAGAGLTVRFGQNLPADYGPPRLRPAVGGPGFLAPLDGFSWYLFAAAEGRATARNLFLEGNTFNQRDGVTINRLSADLQLGLALRYEGVEASYTHVLRTEEYAAQDRFGEFGAINIRTRF